MSNKVTLGQVSFVKLNTVRDFIRELRCYRQTDGQGRTYSTCSVKRGQLMCFMRHSSILSL